MINKNYRVSKATIYNTLDLLVGIDLVTRHVFKNNIAKYEKSFGFRQHDHIILDDNEIIEFCAKSKKFMPHFHIPLQSGSNRILKSMGRRYDKMDFYNRIKKIKKLILDACIGVDVIVGFPSETEEDFMDTYNFINQLDISYLHIFTYSERENTKALKLSPIVPKRIRAERSKRIHAVSYTHLTLPTTPYV